MRTLARVGLFLSLVAILSVGYPATAGPRGASGSAPVSAARIGRSYVYLGDLSEIDRSVGGRPETTGVAPLEMDAPAVDGTYTVLVRLYDAPVEGEAIGDVVEIESIEVADGMFVVEAELPATPGEAWVEVTVVDSSGLYTILEPRDPLGETQGEPQLLLGTDAFVGGGLNNQADGNYAVATGGRNNSALGNKSAIGGGWANQASGPVSVVTGGEKNTGSSFYASVGGGRENRAAATYAVISGGYGNKARGPKTTVGGGRLNDAMGIAATIAGGQQNKALHDYAAVGGGRFNSVTAPKGTIGGGGGDSASDGNLVTDKYGAICGGFANQAGDNAGTVTDAWLATVAGGADNEASGSWSFVGGGLINVASGTESGIAAGNRNRATGVGGFVGGGYGNGATGSRSAVLGGYNNAASGYRSAVGGGYSNEASKEESTVAGGYNNTASGSRSTVAGGRDNAAGGTRATIGGGISNHASGTDSVIAGGYDHTVTGQRGSVPGGYRNSASGTDSFAAGHRAKAQHAGAFVWADDTAFDFASTVADQFNVRATGGVRIVSAVSGTGAPSAGVHLAYGSNSWGTISDVAVKGGFVKVDAPALLRSLSEMPVYSYHLLSQVQQDGEAPVRHVGPTAQDFNEAFAHLFGQVESETHINNMDAIGIALAAVQGLLEQNRALEDRVEALEAESSRLADEIALLRAALPQE